MKIKALIASLALSVLAMNANVYELPTTNVDGKDVYYYEVKPTETLYSLSHKLELTQEEIIKFNPNVENGLKAGAKLYFPVAELGRTDAVKTHVVAKGETLYGLSKKYHVSIGQLLQLNPSAQNGLKEGQKLIIKSVVNAPSSTNALTQGSLHTIAKGETLYSIAVKYNTTVGDLLAMNPGLSVERYNAGVVIRVKNSAPIIANVDCATTNLPQTNEYTKRSQYTDVVEDIVRVGVADTAINQINIALLMPFMLNSKSVDKTMNNNLDFYKGFVLAADSLKKNGVKVKIYAYDTYNNADSVKNVLARPEMSKMHVIITPPKEKSTVTQVAQFSDCNIAYGFNAFSANDSSHFTHKHMIQANIMSENMYAKVAETLASQYIDYVPVIIGSADEKSRADVAELIKAKYASKGVQAIEILYTTQLTDADLAQLDNSKKYIFIPISHVESTIDKYANTIKKYKNSMPQGAVRLFGYPQWTIFNGDKLQLLHDLDAVLYSRFYYDAKDQRCVDFERKFKSAFNKPIIKTTPIQAAIGFDVGCYLINALRQGNGNVVDSQYRYDGLQYGFYFGEKEDGNGIENKALFFISFKPDGAIQRVMY